MAEKLKRVQPTSSIANALNQNAVLDATRPLPMQARGDTTAVATMPEPAPQPQAQPQPQLQPQSTNVVSLPQRVAIQQRQPAPEPQPYTSREPTGEAADVMRQFMLTPTADFTLQKLMAAYSQAIGVELSRSEFLRAVLHALSNSVELHEREARNIGRLRRPKNEAWLFNKRDEMEQAIAKAFVSAMRAAPTME